MRRTGRIGVAAAAATATLTAGVALAATPKPGMWSSGGESGAAFTVKGAKIGPIGVKPNQSLIAPSTFKCNTSNLVVKAAKIPISGGRFHYDGPAYIDRYRAPSRTGHLVWTGKFTSATKVKGTFRFTSPVTPKVTAAGIKFVKKACDSGKHSWVGHPSATGVGVG
jgi:hypothetical protein